MWLVLTKSIRQKDSQYNNNKMKKRSIKNNNLSKGFSYVCIKMSKSAPLKATTRLDRWVACKCASDASVELSLFSFK